jgi:hypothetical protein
MTSQEGAVTGFNTLLHAYNHYTRLIAVLGLVNLLAFFSAPRSVTMRSLLNVTRVHLATR